MERSVTEAVRGLFHLLSDNALAVLAAFALEDVALRKAQWDEIEKQRIEEERRLRLEAIRKLPFASQRNTPRRGRVALDANSIYILFSEGAPIQLPYGARDLLKALADEKFLTNYGWVNAQGFQIAHDPTAIIGENTPMVSFSLRQRWHTALSSDLMIVSYYELLGAAQTVVNEADRQQQQQ